MILSLPLPTLCQRLHTFVAACLLGLPLAALANPQLQTLPRHPTPSAPLLIDLIDAETDLCAPQSTELTLDGHDVSVVLHRADRCKAASDGYRLRVDSPKGLLRWPEAGVYRLRLYDQGGAGSARRLIGFRLLEVEHRRAETAKPETGLWWVESGGDYGDDSQGMGLAIERQGDLLSVNVMGYDADGEPEWLMGAGELSGHIAELALSRFENGRGPFKKPQSPGSVQLAGKLDLQFIDPARAIAWFSRPSTDGGISLQPMSLVRFRFASDPAEAWLGRWVLLPDQDSSRLASRRNTADLPRLLNFDQVSKRLGGFMLSDSQRGHQLDCKQDSARPNSPPLRCVLSDAQGNVIAEFDQIAVNSVTGWANGHGRLRALHDSDGQRPAPLVIPGLSQGSAQ